MNNAQALVAMRPSLSVQVARLRITLKCGLWKGKDRALDVYKKDQRGCTDENEPLPRLNGAITNASLEKDDAGRSISWS